MSDFDNRLEERFMSNFKQFQKNIKSIGNVWSGNNVYFNQMRDCYSATYRPNYPEGCTKDMIIQTIDRTGAYNRGNYELIIWEDGKYISKYFDDVDELNQYFKQQ